MKRRTVSIQGVTAVVTSRTNRTDLQQIRYMRAMALAMPVVPEDEKNAVAEFIYSLSHTESITGAEYYVPDTGFTPEELEMVYQGWLNDHPDVRKAVVGAIVSMEDALVDPVTAPPEKLTEEQRKDPKSAPAEAVSGGD